jgi:hypothetical protein
MHIRMQCLCIHNVKHNGAYSYTSKLTHTLVLPHLRDASSRTGAAKDLGHTRVGERLVLLVALCSSGVYGIHI